MADYQIITSDFVKVHITTSQDNVCFSEKRFPKDITISDLKGKLELVTGGCCSTMEIDLFDSNDVFVCRMGSGDSLLGSYPIQDGMRLHVVDKFSITKELDNISEVDKFEMPDEEYAKKNDTVRAFLIKNKLGQYNEEHKQKKEKIDLEEKILCDSMQVGSRCKVSVPNAPFRLGVIMYAGLVEGLPGQWVGVRYDEPLGKNNGSFKGREYFNCPDKYGAFVRPQTVEMGDFPEINYDLDEEL